MLGRRPPGFLAVDRLLSYLGDNLASARATYEALVESEEVPPRQRHPLIEGDDAFVAHHLSRLDASPEHPRAYLASPRPPLDEVLASATDAAAIARAYCEHGYSMREIASHLGCGLTTVHRRIRSQEAAAAGAR
jgi:transcriptional regulator of acetoin/glycerol metabolism